MMSTLKVAKRNTALSTRLMACSLSATVVLAALPAHAHTSSRTAVRASAPGFSVLHANTSLERKAERDRVRRADSDLPKRVVKASLWTSAIMGALGVGFAVTGQVLTHKLESGFDEGMTARVYDRRTGWGQASNIVAISALLVGVAGLATAGAMYTLDYNRCGPLARNSHRCRVLRQSNAVYHDWGDRVASPSSPTPTTSERDAAGTQAKANKVESEPQASPRAASTPNRAPSAATPKPE